MHRLALSPPTTDAGRAAGRANWLRKLFALPCLMALLGACGCTAGVDETGKVESGEAENLGVAAPELQACAFSCPADHYVSRYNCSVPSDTGCTAVACADPNLRDSAVCFDIPDGSDGEALDDFLACGVEFNPTPKHYPAAYYISDDACEINVYTADPSRANRTRYQPYPSIPDLSYISCGHCRTGDYVTGYSYASYCRLQNGDTTGTNQVTCRDVENLDVGLCGLTECPNLKYYKEKYETALSCSASGATPAGFNKTICRVPKSTTRGLYACGLECPTNFAPVSYSYAPNCNPLGPLPTGINNRVYCTRID